MILAAATFALLMTQPADFSYPAFAGIVFLNGIAFGMFACPNTAGIMNSVPSGHRGVASGMRSTFQNTGMPLSIGLFFTLMIVGLSATVPHAMLAALTANHVPAHVAQPLSHLPAVGYLFAAFLGYNPLKTLLGPHILGVLPTTSAARLTSKEFFPRLIGGPFHHGLVIVLSFAIAACLVAAVASWLRGGRYVHDELEAQKLEAELEATSLNGHRAAAGRQATAGRAPGEAAGISRPGVPAPRASLTERPGPSHDGATGQNGGRANGGALRPAGRRQARGTVGGARHRPQPSMPGDSTRPSSA